MTMKKWLQAAAFVALLSSTSLMSAPRRAAPAIPPPVPLLWKACDANNCLYLLGSFHVLKKTDYPMATEVDQAVQDAEQMMFEIAPEEMADKAKVALAMGRAGIRMDGTLLDRDLTPALRTKLSAWLTKNTAVLARQGISAEVIQRLQPWYVGLLITMTQLQASGMQAEYGLDDVLGRKGLELHRPQAGLETIDEQLAMLSGMARAEQLQFLEESLDEAGKGNGELQELHQAWRTGDAERLWQLGGVQMQRDYPRLYQRIIVERNARWLPRLEARLRDGHHNEDVLVTVGALHLVGPDGVVESLRKRGYTVTRICNLCNDARQN